MPTSATSVTEHPSAAAWCTVPPSAPTAGTPSSSTARPTSSRVRARPKASVTAWKLVRRSSSACSASARACNAEVRADSTHRPRSMASPASCA
ncbi:hypothetical protein ACN28I_31160 [Archangium gephyra]|uniref:hypothetical protein n=1 Tax=Archangium gephyra TaxID=48 RepID=UPI003B7AA465